MCYKVSTPEAASLRAYLAPYEIGVSSYNHYYHADGFIRPYLPILSGDNKKMVTTGRWTLLPSWVKTEEEALAYAHTLNAACETIFEAEAYKDYIPVNRCLLFVDGFFEPNHPTPKVVIPYYVRAIDRTPLALGGVYADWLNKDTAEVIRTFTVITTPPNDLLKRIHNQGDRMPFIVAPDQWDKWLCPITKEEIIDMMQPFPDGSLEGFSVSGLVYQNGVNTNVPEVQVEFRE